MACNRVTVEVPPERVWSVLADASKYPGWVVGAKEIRAVDGDWPEPGSRFHHSVGVGPLTLQDNTKSIEADAPHRLVLEARARPLGKARIELDLRPVEGGTEIVMHEVVSSPPVMSLLNFCFDPLTYTRNAESLRRLSELAIAAAGEPPT